MSNIKRKYKSSTGEQTSSATKFSTYENTSPPIKIRDNKEIFELCSIHREIPIMPDGILET